MEIGRTVVRSEVLARDRMTLRAAKGAALRMTTLVWVRDGTHQSKETDFGSK